MQQTLSKAALYRQNQTFGRSGGVSEQNRHRGFVPAFYETQSHKAVVSRFANGIAAPIHVLEGLPEAWVVERDQTNRVITVKGSVIAGFLRDGQFYTREQAALAVDREAFEPFTETRSAV